MNVRSSSMPIASAAVLSVIAQIGAAVPAAGSEPSWGPEMVVAASSRGSSLAVDAQSNTWVVWETLHGTIRVAQRPPGGTWGEPREIARTNSAMAEPQVAADSAGNLTVAWITYRQGFTDGVKAVTRNARGGWSDPIRISEDKRVRGYGTDGKGPWGARWLDLGVSPKGAVTVAWAWGSEDRNKAWRIQSVYRRPGRDWGGVVTLTGATGAREPQVGIAADGTVTLLYARQPVGRPWSLLSRVRHPGRGWSDATVVSDRGYRPQLAVDRSGDAVVVFMATSSRVMAAYRPHGAPWRSPRQLSPQGIGGDKTFALAMNGRGAVLVAFAGPHGTVDLVQRTPHDPWSAPARVVDSPDWIGHVAVALNGVGDTLLTWGEYALYGMYLPNGGTWTSQVTLSPETDVDVLETIDAEVAQNGDALVMWDQEDMPLKVRVGAAP
jgi:hypothetical protein